MLRRYGTPLRLTLMAADAASAGVLFILVSIFRFGDVWVDAWRAADADPVVAAAIYAGALLTTLWLLGLYRPRARWSWRRDTVDILRGLLLLAVLSLAILFVAKLPDVSRVFLGELFAAQAAVTITSRLVVRRLYAVVRSRGHNASFVLIVGDGPEAADYARRLVAHEQLGVRVMGCVRGPAADAPAPGASASPAAQAGASQTAPSTVRPDGLEVLGNLDDLVQILHGSVVDEVAICLPLASIAFVEPVARLCEDEGKIVRIPSPLAGLSLAGATEDSLDGLRILSLVRGPDHAIAMMAKRALDIVGATAALIALSPLLVGVAAYIIAKDGRPAIFRQTRVGRHGRTFAVVKFRSMVKDAEARYREVAALSDTKGAAFKMTDDPRITAWGRFLRRTSIDELPQFLNVLRGDMSLVGPRPAPPREVDEYDIWHRRRLSVKPGITGLWQVEARLDEDFDNRARLDLHYIDNWSLLLDLKIMLRTVPALLQGR